jgi:hypothetical protein
MRGQLKPGSYRFIPGTGPLDNAANHTGNWLQRQTAVAAFDSSSLYWHAVTAP